jgi:hypothetical protein
MIPKIDLAPPACQQKKQGQVSNISINHAKTKKKLNLIFLATFISGVRSEFHFRTCIFRPSSKSSCVLGDSPPDPLFLASLGALSLVKLHHCLVRASKRRSSWRANQPLFSKSSCFLGDPPPDPRILASLGALSLAKLHPCLNYNCHQLDALRSLEGRPLTYVIQLLEYAPWSGKKRNNNKSSYFLGDPPPDPRFLPSLGTLSLAELITTP